MASTITDRLQGISTSVAVKAPCRVATTANITLSGLQTVDTVLLVDNDRVLVKNQTTTTQNGIYYAHSTSWERAEDLDSGDDVVDGTVVFINEGTTNLHNWFVADTSAAFPIVIGTDHITWSVTYVSLTPVSQATEALAGIAEIATQAETNTGTDDLRIVTPLKLKTVLQATPYDTTITSTDASATGGPKFTLYRNSASPAASDVLGIIEWDGKDSAGNLQNYGTIEVDILDATNTSEDSKFIIKPLIAGTATAALTVGPGVQVGAPTGGDKGVGTVNATQYYRNGTLAGGKLIDRAYVEYAGNADLTGTIPFDDTPPLISEGVQVLTLDVTTTSATQIVRLRFSGQFAWGSSVTPTWSMFQGNICIHATTGPNFAAENRASINMVREILVGSAITTTFTVRVGTAGGTAVRANGTTAARLYGSVSSVTLTADVIEP